jgi:hypothetical protein
MITLLSYRRSSVVWKNSPTRRRCKPSDANIIDNKRSSWAHVSRRSFRDALVRSRVVCSLRRSPIYFQSKISNSSGCRTEQWDISSNGSEASWSSRTCFVYRVSHANFVGSDRPVIVRGKCQLSHYTQLMRLLKGSILIEKCRIG